MTVTRTFLPWYREGFATTLVGAPPAGAGRAALPATVTLRGTDRTRSLPAELAGPGDVVGLDPREIRRTEPYDGCNDFEPSYFPYVELTRPDLPWRFSPFGQQQPQLTDPQHPGATVQATLLRPWLALVVVPAEAATLTGAPPGGLPVLATDGAQLSNPIEAWAWAHVQVVTTPGQRVEDALADPTRQTTRLLCPRRLQPATRYLACLVPTFAAGRDALASTGTTTDPLGPAWDPGQPARLPVYFNWSFTTGEGGSFETFVRRLRPQPAPPAAAGRVIAVDSPGWGASGTAGATTVMQGALRPVGPTEPPPDPTLAASLRTAISAPGGTVQLRPPMYGQDFQGGTSAIPPDASGWLTQLNCDPRRRIAAGLAAWVVAVEQEDFADRAWRQLADAGLATPTATSADLAAVVGESLGRRHQPAALASAPAAMTRLLRAGGPLGNVGAAAATLAARSLGAAISGVDQPSRPTNAVAPTRAAIAQGDGGQSAPGSAGGQFTPTFPEPAYTLLRAVAAEWLLPGAGDIPPESVLLVQSNPAFVEAFLVGLNHALARELVWRRYPLQPAGTMARNFWTGNGLADVPALAGWEAGSDLGSHATDPGQLVLLVRGALLRRFPTAAIYLSRTEADGTETHLPPTMTGTLGTDLAFYGFPITAQQALSADGGWAVVLQEAVDHVRFGIDDPSETGMATLDSWQDLDWGHSHLQGHTHVPVVGPLLGAVLPASAGATATATWGWSAGHMAVALQQPAFRVRIPIGLWLTELVPTGQ